MSTIAHQLDRPVVSGCSAVLAHTPNLARHGSKPARVLQAEPHRAEAFIAHSRDFDAAVGYPPHQAYLGAVHPRALPPRPWTTQALDGASRHAGVGEIMPEDEFLGLMAAVDEFELLVLDPEVAKQAAEALDHHPLGLAAILPLERITDSAGDPARVLDEPGALPVHLDGHRVAGAVRSGHEADESLSASVLLENLACKATGVLAARHLLSRRGLDAADIDYVLSCSEEAVGDRYQRGGGNMAKAVAAAAGLRKASGADVKNFCAAPVPALVFAASLVAAGVVDRVMVVAGGSVPKLGMKFEGHLSHDLPVLEDVLGGAAAVVERPDGASPSLRLDLVGRHLVEAGASNQQIVEALALEPLERVGLGATDVDDYATELHNPEITEPQGSGNVAERNYRTLAALAARRGDIDRADIDHFVAGHGMPGFAPTQGHIASALCYLPHALARLGAGDARRVQLMAKGSLFLGRMTQQSDGMSVVLEA